MNDIFLIQGSTLTNTADTIRKYIDDQSSISPEDFPEKIDEVYNEGKGDAEPNLQNDKSVTPTAAGFTVEPDTGYDGLRQVTVKAAPLQTKNITANGEYTPAAGNLGFSKVTVKVADTPCNHTFGTKKVKPATSETTYNASEDNYSGYDTFTVEAMPTVSRADTTITSTKNNSNNTIKLTAYNNQDTGYVTGSNETDEVTVSISASGKTATATDGTTSISVDIDDGSVKITGGGLSGGGSVTPTVSLSSGGDTNMSNITVGSKDTSDYPYYFKVEGSSSSESSTVTRAAVAETYTAGYIPAKSSTTVISSDSKTVSVNAGNGSSYVGLKSAAISASGSATASATVEPGELSVITQVIPVSGKTLILPEVTTSSNDISTKYYAVVRPQVEKSSASISGSGTASASVSTAGYAPTSLTGSGSVSVSGTATSSAKYGDSYYLSIPELNTNGVEITAIEKSGIKVAVEANVNAITPGYADGAIVSKNEITSQLPAAKWRDYGEAYYQCSPNKDGSVHVYKDLAKEGWLSGTGYGFDLSGTIYPSHWDSNTTGLKAENIKAGAAIFGVTGTYTPELGLMPVMLKENGTIAYQSLSAALHEHGSTNTSVADTDYDSTDYGVKIVPKAPGQCIVWCLTKSGSTYGVTLYHVIVEKNE